jgi:hypothetical protein
MINIEWNAPTKKVIVLLESTSWSRFWFEEFVKPIFDAGALDYELVERKETGLIVETVRDIIWNAKDQIKNDIQDQVETDILKKKQGWFSSGITVEEQEKEIKKVEKQAIKLYAPHLHKPLYNPNVGLVAMGPVTWKHLLYGIQYGSLCDPTYPREFSEKREPYVDYDYSEFEYPTLGYITSVNKTRLSRFFGWFTRRYEAQELGNEALQIVFGMTRPFKKEDCNKGLEHLVPLVGKSEKDAKPFDVMCQKWSEEAEKVDISSVLIEKLKVYN